MADDEDLFGDDDDLFWLDPALDSLVTSAPAPPPRPAPPAPRQALPPRPLVVHPTKRPVAAGVSRPIPPAIQRKAQPPPAKRPRVDVDPNPFNRGPPPPVVKQERIREVEEEMPDISVTENGYSASSAAASKAPNGHGQPIRREGSAARMPPPPVPPPKPRPAPVMPEPQTRPIVEPAPAPPHVSPEELKELETLRKLKLSLEERLQAKTGEIAIIRRRLNQAEEKQATQTEETTRIQRSLEQRLEEKEKEHQTHLGRLEIEHAFRKQELETSARRPTSSARTSSARRRPIASGSMGPPPLPSPSIGRGGNRPGRSGAAATKPSGISGFKNAFESSPIAPRRRESPLKLGGSKGKGVAGLPSRLMLVADEAIPEEDESEDSLMLVDSRGVREWKGEPEEELILEEPMEVEHRDTRAEILATLLNHATWTPLSMDSATDSLSLSTASFSSLRLSTSSRGSTYTSSSSRRFALSSSSSTSIFRSSTAPSPPKPTLTPTFHALTNLPLTDTHSPSYAPLSRQLFLALSKPAESLPHALTSSLLDLGDLFLSLGLLSPLTALLSLVGTLSRFPDLSEGLVPFLGLTSKVLVKYGRPPSLSAAAVVGATTTGQPGGRKKRSRAGRGSLAAAAKEREREEMEGERVEVKDEVRNPLLFAVLGVLEGLAWRCGDAFAGFLQKHSRAVTTLLDPRHPPEILVASTRFIATLACQPALYHPLLTLQFDKASSLTTSSTLLDRLAILLPTPRATVPLLAVASILSATHINAVVQLSASASLVPEVLEVVFRATRAVWNTEGEEMPAAGRRKMSLTLEKLCMSAHLFLHLTAHLNLADFFVKSDYLGLLERFTIAFGTLAFAPLPDWIRGAEKERLQEVCFLAQEVMEEVFPQESEEVENCFVALPDEEDEEENAI